MTRQHSASVTVDGRVPAIAVNDGRMLRFRFAPRDAKVWSYVVRSDYPALDGASGQFTAILPPAERTLRASTVHAQWWTDDPDPAAAGGPHAGAKHVSRWRRAFLTDFAERMRRAQDVPR